MSNYAKLKGRVVRQPVHDLYWLMCWTVNHKVTVPMDEWVENLASIAQALGFPPGQDGRDVVARWIYVDSLAADRDLKVAS